MTTPQDAGKPKLSVLLIPPDKCREAFVLRHVVTHYFLQTSRDAGGKPTNKWVVPFKQARLFHRFSDVRQCQSVNKMEKMTEVMSVKAYLQADVVASVEVV